MMSVKDLMPETAKKIVQFRRMVGASKADALIRRALAGEPGLFLSLENHLCFGTPPLTNHICGWDYNDRLYRVADPWWMDDAREFALTLGIEVNVVSIADFDEALFRANQLRDILRRVAYG